VAGALRLDRRPAQGFVLLLAASVTQPTLAFAWIPLRTCLAAEERRLRFPAESALNCC